MYSMTLPFRLYKSVMVFYNKVTFNLLALTYELFKVALIGHYYLTGTKPLMMIIAFSKGPLTYIREERNVKILGTFSLAGH